MTRQRLAYVIISRVISYKHRTTVTMISPHKRHFKGYSTHRYTRPLNDGQPMESKLRWPGTPEWKNVALEAINLFNRVTSIQLLNFQVIL